MYYGHLSGHLPGVSGARHLPQPDVGYSPVEKGIMAQLSKRPVKEGPTLKKTPASSRPRLPQ